MDVYTLEEIDAFLVVTSLTTKPKIYTQHEESKVLVRA